MTLAEFDNEIRTRFPIIAGVDEAGRVFSKLSVSTSSSK